MIDHSNAEEDLRVIRTLMERATIYRAISAPTALVAGLLSYPRFRCHSRARRDHAPSCDSAA